MILPSIKKSIRNFSKNNLRGFTLIEMLVGMTAFLIVIGIVLGLFVFALQQQRRALANQVLLGQISYTLEFMSRALRMAGKELGDGCLSQYGLNYENYGGTSGIKFINTLENNDCQAFFLQDGQLKYQKDLDNPPLPDPLDLSSNKLDITQLKFNLIGVAQPPPPTGDNLQPKVTISMEIKSTVIIQGQPVLKIQTTISQRKLDVQY